MRGEPSNLAARDCTAVAQRLSPSQTLRGHLRRLQRPGHLLEGFRRDVRRPGQRPRPVQGHLRRACPVGCVRARSARPRARPRVHRPGHHLLAIGPGTSVPAGSRAAGDFRGRVVQAGARHHPAGQGAGALPRRYLRRAGDPARRRHPAPAGDFLRALPPRGRGYRPAQRRAHPRRRHRPGPGRPGQLPGARGQSALAVGGVLRDGEPPHDGAGLPEPVRHQSRAGGRRLLVASAALAAQLGGHQRGGPDDRRSHPRRVQLGLLRAFTAGPSDGCRTRRRARPVLPRQHRVHAHHRGRAPGRRHLPPHRRRVPRPDAVSARLGARRRRAAQRRAGRQRRHLQRGRQRRRRRQARLHLCADDHRVLPGGEAAAGQCRHLPLLAR